MNDMKLTDLDELVQTIRDKTSRAYIIEAINAYRGGAYRAAIVATWIAVIYDIISKLRELSAADDKAVSDLIRKVDSYIQDRSTKNIQSMANLEYNLIEVVSKEPYDFLTEVEKIDLERLKKDRHACAHPAFVAEDFLFQPTPELVRTHIVHAVQHLLQHRPVQGKTALKRILRDIQGTSFPDTKEGVFNFLNERYFDRAKNVFIRNLIIVLIKTLLRGENPELHGKERKIIYTLMAVSEKYRNLYEETTREQINKIAENLESERFIQIFHLLKADQTCWSRLNESVKEQIKQILNITSQQENVAEILYTNEVFDSIHIPDLEPLILPAFETLNPRDQETVIAENVSCPHPKFVEKSVELYIQADSPIQAKDRGEKILVPLTRYFTADHIRKILIEGVKNNGVIADATGTPDILVQLFEKTRDLFEQTKSMWQELIKYIDDTESPESETDYSNLREKLKNYGIESKLLEQQV